MGNSESEFAANKVYLFVGSDPLQSDDPKTFPFQFTTIEALTLQMRVSLDLLQQPTEMDPIYIALRLENDEGAGSWMSGYFQPVHQHYGGYYSYTSVCYCDGYSHLNSFVDWNQEIYSFSSYAGQPQNEEFVLHSAAPTLLFQFMVFFYTFFDFFVRK